MSDLPNPDEPEYFIPLDHDQLAELGRLTSAWSQIDFMLVLVVAVITKTEIGWMMTFCDNMMSGGRINLFRKLIVHIESDETRKLATALCERLGKLVGQRNHIVHGLWGYHINQEKKKQYPACHNGANPQAPIYAATLPDLRKRVIAETRQIGLILRTLSPKDFNRGVPPEKFLFGPGPPPDWI
jgi:hypothetical protein